MVFPKLVRPEMCRTPITCEFDQEGYSPEGEPLESIHFSGKCNYQDGARRVYTDQKKLVEITGKALFDGDICPELPVVHAGTAVVFGVSRRIVYGRKHRNPDGTVNYTEVDLE